MMNPGCSSRAFVKSAMASFGRSFYFSFVYVAGIIVLSFLTALLLNRELFLRTASRTMIYMPYVANVVAMFEALSELSGRG